MKKLPRLTPDRFWALFILLCLLLVAFGGTALILLLQGRDVPGEVWTFLVGLGGGITGLLFQKKDGDNG